MHCFPSAFSQSPLAISFRLHLNAYILLFESLNNAFMRTKKYAWNKLDRLMMRIKVKKLWNHLVNIAFHSLQIVPIVNGCERSRAIQYFIYKSEISRHVSCFLRNYLIFSPWHDESEACLALASAMISNLSGVVLLLFVSTCTVAGQLMFESDSLEGCGDL